ncbi:MAG: glycine/sarcosine N-methyltransferase [Clostridiales bacterium]|jgi:2-polyprenyl-3-methyl-5-hydroxy-6-metoxy-1,4-benzoquinol methylase|nr:glycine/sarcosine N-methyltransferase [Clostridiales bacterium]
MKFYEAIAAYYDDIFPLGVKQLCVMTSVAGDPPAKILDLACGTGSYSLALAEKGYQVTASDLDDSMIQKLSTKNQLLDFPVEVKQFNMRDVAESVDERYDAIINIGNSIVHLGSFEEVQKCIKGMKRVLNPGGRLLIQIVNYDRVIYHFVSKLPTIVNKRAGLTFKRHYTHDFENHRILFNGILEVGDYHSNQLTTLLPLKCENLVDMLKLAGFKDIAIYGGFDLSPFKALESMSLVVIAK